MRLVARFEFDGTNYSGWQIQPRDVTLQGEIEKALENMCQRHIPVTEVFAFHSPARRSLLTLDVRPERLFNFRSSLENFMGVSHLREY